MTRTLFLRGLLGRPYRAGAEGPEAFDCFGLVAHVSATLFGRPVPRGDFVRARGLFVPATLPIDGAIVLLRGAERHVGLWLSPEGGVLHAVERKGVVFDDVAALPLTGFGVPRFFNPR